MMASIFSALTSSRSPTGTPRSFGFWEGSQLQDSGAHRQCGAPGHAPRFVAGPIAILQKMAWPRENKYLHVHVHDLLSFELQKYFSKCFEHWKNAAHQT